MNSKKKPKMILRLKIDEITPVEIPIFSEKEIDIKLQPLL